VTEYIKLTWQKLAIIFISIFILVSGWALLSAQFDAKTIKIDIEAAQDVTRNEAKV
jgi:hypothetical protein